MTMETATAYVIGAMAASYLLLAWTCSQLPVHALHMLRRIGWKKSKPEFWESIPEWATTTQKLQDLMVIYDICPFLETLVGCKFCVSLHISFWTSLAVYTTAFLSGCTLPWAFIPAAAFSWPVIMLLVHRVAGK